MDSGVRWVRKSPGHFCPGQMRPSAHRRPGYPLAGCSPAEPASVSPGAAKGSLTTGEEQGQARPRDMKAPCGAGGTQTGGTAVAGQVREDGTATSDGPRLPVLLV